MAEDIGKDTGKNVVSGDFMAKGCPLLSSASLGAVLYSLFTVCFMSCVRLFWGVGTRRESEATTPLNFDRMPIKGA